MSRDIIGGAAGAAAGTPAALPDVAIWKRGQRLVELAWDFAALFDCARLTSDAATRARLAGHARAAAAQLVGEVAAMVGLIEVMTAHPPPPKAPPARHWQDREEG